MPANLVYIISLKNIGTGLTMLSRSRINDMVKLMSIFYLISILLFTLLPEPRTVRAQEALKNCGNLNTEDCLSLYGPWQDYVANGASNACTPAGSSSGSEDSSTENDTGTATLKEFVDKYGQSAFNVGKQFGIPYEAILSQAILESGYGKSDLTVRGYNFFGIKAGSSWTGRVITLRTREQRSDGSEYFVLADFRAYDSAEDGFRGYGEFITSNSRYRNALNFPGDPFKYIEEIRTAGYATALDYVTLNHKLIKSIQAYIAETKAFPPSSEVTPDVSPPTVGSDPDDTSGCDTSSETPSSTDPDGNKGIAKEILTAKGLAEDEWQCLEKLWTRESGWKVNAINDAEKNNDTNRNRLLDIADGEDISETEDDAYGIPQSKPGGKMASVGADWRTNAKTQITWGLQYIEERYSTPCGAWSHSESKGWY